MRVAINNNCNSKCPYCFAGRMGIEANSNISLADYEKILKWMVESGDNEIYIYGGEPTLHPEFEQILKITEKYFQTYSWIRFGIFTNAVELYKYVDLLKPYIHYLINVNSIKTLGDEVKFKKMAESLDLLQVKLNVFNKDNPVATLGCNLHVEQQDYSFFWKMVDRYKSPNVRVSVASPQNNKYLYDRDSYFKIMKPVFLDFIRTAKQKGCRVVIDCNQIPACYFTNVELFEILDNCIHPENLGKCQNFQQICKPDLSISCCFGDDNFKHNAKSIFDFKNMQEISDWSEGLRLPQIEDHYLPKCDGCILKENQMCLASCFGFLDRKSNTQK